MSENQRDMEEILRKITIDEVYISPLKRRRVRREDGSEIMEEVPHAIRPSGSMIMDAVVQILFFRRVFQINQIARILGVDPVKLAGAMQILTGMPMQDFLNIFRLYLVQEYLACTDLSLSQIAACCDFSSYGPEFVADRRVLRFLQPVVVVSCIHEGDRVFACGLSPQPSA